jgi:hypothetical protein
LKRTFWVRESQSPTFAQDCRSYILLGKFSHIYNSEFGLWFITSPAPKNPGVLCRSNTTIRKISKKEWLAAVGPRGKTELLEDLSGIRWVYVARRLCRWTILPKVWRDALRRFSCRDALQDFATYDRAAEPIRIARA